MTLHSITFGRQLKCLSEQKFFMRMVDMVNNTHVNQSKNELYTKTAESVVENTPQPIKFL